MRVHVVISRFRYGGGYVSPPGPWTPPDDRTASRLIQARCIRPMTPNEERRQGRQRADAVERKQGIEVPTMEEVIAAGYSEAAAVKIIERQEALALLVADGMTLGEAEGWVAEAEAEARAEAEKIEAEAKGEAIEAETPEDTGPAEEPAETPEPEPVAEEPEPEPEPDPKAKTKIKPKKKRRR